MDTLNSISHRKHAGLPPLDDLIQHPRDFLSRQREVYLDALFESNYSLSKYIKKSAYIFTLWHWILFVKKLTIKNQPYNRLLSQTQNTLFPLSIMRCSLGYQ